MKNSATEVMKRIIALGPDATEVEVSPEEYSDIASSFCWSDLPPSPPIKAEGSVASVGGLFSAPISGRYVEYDHHAPEYLRAMDEWRRKIAEDSRATDLTMYSPYGRVKLIIRK